MAATVRCLRSLTLVADVLFMVLGVADAVLLLLLLLPEVSLLPLPRWLLPPLLLPLLPALLAVPVGFLGLSAARNQRRWKVIGVAALQVLLAAALAVLAGWLVFQWFTPRVEADLTALMTESLHDAKWHSVYYELQCCGPAGPASFLHGPGSTAAPGAPALGIPPTCCVRDAAGRAAGAALCAQLYTQGCAGPAADRVRRLLRAEAAVHAGAALLMLMCAVSSAFLADALKREERKRREQQVAQEDKPLRSPMLSQRF